MNEPDAGARRLVFNRYARPGFSGAGTFVYSSDPVVQLDWLLDGARTARQLERLRGTRLAAAADSIFGASLEWPFRAYAVRLLSEPSGEADALGAPLGDAPPQPVTLDRRRGEIGEARVLEQPPDAAAARLCLFNVLVALEWTPDQYTMRQLEWGFRAASDFLYDVTDGRMAFGQVIFGGRELMPCADVQVLASDRMLPRSWVDGLHSAEKYLPVRAGRGVWHNRNRVTIDWSEPEAYRILVHEWAHYALGLRDQYLASLALPGAAGAATLVVPSAGMSSTSIMATLEGTSELVPHANGDSRGNRSAEWAEITRRFPFLAPSARPLAGPGRLPLPLPRFERVGSLGSTYEGRRARRRAGSPDPLHERRGPYLAPPAGPGGALPRAPVADDSCWVYVLRGEAGRDPSRLIAQGTLDARSAADGFLLLGAESGDEVVLVGRDAAGAPVVARSLVEVAEDPADPGRSVARAAAWRDATPAVMPLVAVEPRPPQPGSAPDDIVVRVHVDARGGPAPERTLVFALAQGEAPRAGDGYRVSTLDGHVLVRWGERLLISTFSQGGGPPSHVPASANPTTAGSADGNVMLFFSQDDGRPEFREVRELKVVTTLVHGAAADAPGGFVFALSGSRPLPPVTTPTLVAYHNAAGGPGAYVIERLAGQAWEPLAPLYAPAGQIFVAAALDAAGAPALVRGGAGAPVEYYRLRRAD